MTIVPSLTTPASRGPGPRPNLSDDAAKAITRQRLRLLGYIVAFFLMLQVIVLLLLPAPWGENWLKVSLVSLVVAGTLPMIATVLQYVVVGMNWFRIRYKKLTPCYPRTAIIVPAWNESAVIGTTIEHLLAMEYPPERLRVYVVDDASTDETPNIVRTKAEQFPDRVVLLRREQGGQGKAHTLNHGIREILKEEWTEAVLIIDADVLFESTALRRMTRHLSDPDVGAVTAYIKEGSRPGNYLTRFIGYEYITAQAMSRRAQNVFGALACLAGGAQLHTRQNLELLGGRIDTSSLAEDTVTTLKTQIDGRKVVFEGNATVWAEEPEDLVGLWKQRLRWGRGNVQVSLQFADVWGRWGRFPSVGGLIFGFIWFTILLMPLLMVGTTIGLIGLHFIDPSLAWWLFQYYWIWNAVIYLFTVFLTLSVDPEMGKYAWFQGLCFPGLISLLIIGYCVHPGYFGVYLNQIANAGSTALGFNVHLSVMLFMYLWVSFCMVVAYAAKLVSHVRGLRWVGAVLIYIGGYGPFLCAVTFASYVKEIANKSARWDKTIKTGKVAIRQ